MLAMYHVNAITRPTSIQFLPAYAGVLVVVCRVCRLLEDYMSVGCELVLGFGVRVGGRSYLHTV